MSDSRVTGVNKNSHSFSWSLHCSGGDVINTQLNKELLGYTCERDTLKKKIRINLEERQSGCGRQIGS